MSAPVAGLWQMLRDELQQEAEATRRLLERIPEAQLSWTPHPRSMTLGQLAHHVAILPGAIAEELEPEVAQVPNVPLPQTTSVAEALRTLDESVACASAALERWGDGKLAAEWRLQAGDHVVFALPRRQAVRSIMLNHSYHHRGQLTVYLRLLDVPLPATYGDSADQRALSPEEAS